MTEQWDNIPEELKWNRNWLLAGPNEKGELKVPCTIRDGRPVHGSSTDPAQWMDFDTCCEWAEHFGYGIGYVLSKDDAYACIDLDVKNANNEPNPQKWTTPEQMERFQQIVKRFDSYTELSRGGQGVHVWVRGKIGAGCKFDGVEVYSQERFIACTGRVVVSAEINHNQELLDLLVAQIRERQGAAGAGGLDLVELEEEETDVAIIERAISAGNAEKFNQLCTMTAGPQGSWVGHYQSQSEADLALLSIFTFYSKSNEQCRRLFRMTGLAQREKSMKDDRYLNATLRLIRSRQAREEAISEQQRAMAAALVQEMQAQRLAESAAQPQQGHAQPAQAPIAGSAPLPTDNGLPWPPGLAGAIAQHIYRNAPRPVKEVAIVSTLGLLAGICGKAYQIPQSGLNIYVVLVAQSAVGKEVMHSGIGHILAELRESCPPVQRFVDFADFASGPALQKACSANTSFVNVAGEWGKKLERLAREDGRDAAMQSLRAVMTNLYQKSGPQSVVGGITYSNKDQNVASVNGVAYSMIGETTPSTFFNSLTDTMMEDGFLSRFTIVEYTGNRQPLNRNAAQPMEQGLAMALHQLVVQAITLLDRFTNCHVQFEQTAQATLDEFDKKCDYQINSTQDETWRQMWNRAHLKVLRISALLAVADNHLVPVVYPQHVAWALDLVQRDIAMFQRRLESGDIGTGDTVRESKVLAIMREYLQAGASGGYNVDKGMLAAGIIPRKVLAIRCARVNAFTTHRMGASAALDSTLRTLCENGHIAEVDKGKLVAEHNFHGKCYRILSLPASR